MEPQTADKLKKVDEAIGRFVRPDAFPLAIWMLKPGEALPPDVRVPSQSFKESWIVCESIGVARALWLGNRGRT